MQDNARILLRIVREVNAQNYTIPRQMMGILKKCLTITDDDIPGIGELLAMSKIRLMFACYL